MATSADNIRGVLEDFVDELDGRLSTHEIERVLSKDKDDLTSKDLGQKPETFTEQYLIYPIFDAIGFEYDKQPYGQTGDKTVWPDSEITNLSKKVAVEHKPLNNVGEGLSDVTVYLDSKTVDADYGIVSDGIIWVVKAAERGGDAADYPEVARIDLSQLLLAVARERGHLGPGLNDTDIDEKIEKFVELFDIDAFDEFITVSAPQQLRDERKRNIDEFYQLYIELLFGKSNEYDYETSLMDDIEEPEWAPESEKRRFAVTLVNRLLFIKILEDKAVVPDNLLIDRTDAYENNKDAFVQNLYSSQIKPLFYDLFNTPKGERKSHLRSGWYRKVPYLNGGLFREAVDNEREYDVHDGILSDVIRKLIEGSELSEDTNGGDESIDPAVLGSVFEKTINFMGGEYGTQKDIGAYYTPDDITQLIAEQSVDPKVRDVLIETYGGAYSEGVRERMEEYELGEILRQIEQGEGWFGDSAATEKAYERLGELTAVDPACGSGHFLTSVMEEIHRARKSLYRGLNRGEEPSGKDEYEAKKHLALKCIYGVDVDPIAVEIARLRVWLKIVEDGWDDNYGRLPNIELNIVSGNSLVGLPVELEGQIQADIWDDRLDELVRLRRQYKSEEETAEKDEVDAVIEEIRSELDAEFLKRLNQTVETSVDTPEEWESVIDSISDSRLHPSVQSVQVKRQDGEAFSDSEKERLGDLGLRPYSKSARMDVAKRHDEIKDGKSTVSNAEAKEEIVEALTSLIEGGYVFEEVLRQPLACDLDNILGDPFHWTAEFPEVATEDPNGNGQSVAFDLVVGNPPYGDLLSDSEKYLIDWYESADLNEVSMQFIERQTRLLTDGGYYGNITSLRFVYQRNAYPVHDMMREKLSGIRIACFSHRPQPVFENATVRSAVISGRKDTNAVSNIYTTELIMLTDSNREQVLENLTYSDVKGLLLREDMGSDERDGYEILPKVGNNRDILEKLRDEYDRSLANVREDKTNHPNFRKRGGGYWLGFAPENEWGDLTSIQPLYYETELHRDAAFLLVNSNLFYVYWLTYSNFRNFDFGHIDKFPVPDDETLEESKKDIQHYKELLWQAHLDNPGKKSDERFDMTGVKPVINEIEGELVAKWFDLSDDDVDKLQEYHEEFGRARRKSASVSDYESR